ncbi:hypothetical protein ACRAWD_26725 [Caulobacter segnis]
MPRHLRRLRDDEAGCGALRVVFCHEVGRDEPRARPVARQWGHHDTIGERQVAKSVGLEQGVAGHSRFFARILELGGRMRSRFIQELADVVQEALGILEGGDVVGHVLDPSA